MRVKGSVSARATRQPSPFLHCMPGKTEVDMLRRFKSKAPEKDKNAAANATEVIGGMVQQQHSVVEPVVARPRIPKAGTDSCIGSGMSIVGKIECTGPAQIFGRIEGELRASQLLIGNGAQVEGSVIAQDVTVCGRVKGTVRRLEVHMYDGHAMLDVVCRLLFSIEEHAQFEG